MKPDNFRLIMAIIAALIVGTFVMLGYNFSHFESSVIAILTFISVRQSFILRDLEELTSHNAPKEKQE